MNSYLSREEKENFVRATALVALLEVTIDGYSKAKSTDPAFLRYMRTGRTMLAKALTMRADALDPDAKAEFAKQVARLELICVPTPEAKKAHQELIALKTTIPMDIQDFEDWYENVIEGTCKKCLRADFQECKARRVLTKYGVYPIDPEAKTKCQYSYVGTPESDKPVPETEADQVSAGRYNTADVEYQALETKVNEEYLPRIAELEGEVNTLKAKGERDDEAKKILNEANEQLNDQVKAMKAQLHAAAAVPEEETIDKKSGLISVTLGLRDAHKLELDITEPLAAALFSALQRNKDSRGICAAHVNDELIAVDMQDVVTIQASGLKPPQPQQPLRRPAAPAPEYEDDGERERYRVECKCGAEYYCTMNIRNRARCRECKAPVFADRNAEPAKDPMDGVVATLLTNRYWVEKDSSYEEREREFKPSTSRPVDRNLRNISQNHGRNYEDPCNPFEE